MSLWGRTDTENDKPKWLTDAEKEDVFFVSIEESKVASNRAKGFNHPGWWRYKEYKDGNEIATASVVQGRIQREELTGGQGYYSLSPPAVTINSNSGRGAVIDAVVVDGKVTELNVINGGRGYGENDIVFIARPNREVAIATANMELFDEGDEASGLSVSDIVVEYSGLGYHSDFITDTTDGGMITIAEPFRAATITFGVTDGSITSYDISDGGTGYINNNAITFNAPATDTGVMATGTIETNDNGNIVGINITNGGTGYTSDSLSYTITSEVVYTQATVDSIVVEADGGKITSIVVDEKGRGYTEAPEITFKSLTEGGVMSSTGVQRYTSQDMAFATVTFEEFISSRQPECLVAFPVATAESGDSADDSVVADQ